MSSCIITKFEQSIVAKSCSCSASYPDCPRRRHLLSHLFLRSTMMQRFETWIWDWIFPFLTENDLSRLDRGICNHEMRVIFLDSLKLCSRTCGFRLEWSDKSADFLNWITRRRMQHHIVYVPPLPYNISVDVAARSVQHLVQLRRVTVVKDDDDSHTRPVYHLSSESKNILGQQQFRLLCLHHAFECKNNNHGKATCEKFYCQIFKDLWTHLHTCQNPQCDTPMCLNSRNILKHYSGCRKNKNINCLLCMPVRNRHAKQVRYTLVSKHLYMVNEHHLLCSLIDASHYLTPPVYKVIQE